MPNNFGIKDIKPANLGAKEIKPQSVSVKPGNENRVYEQVLTAGMYMGIPPFTYPEEQTIISPFSP